MKLAIIGYGKMGRAVEVAARARAHEISAIIDPSGAGTATEISATNLNGAEAAIDFTTPEFVVENIKRLAALKTNVIVGTTGWYEQLPAVEKIIQENQSGLLYAGNFSVAVNVFYAIVAEAARRLNLIEGIDVALHETHHTGKRDAPSGTARELAQVVLENFPRKQKLLLDNAEQPVRPESLQISSSRVGKVVGVHTVTFDGASDTIQLTHAGKNRDGYALGAVLAAEWLASRHGVFTARDWIGA